MYIKSLIASLGLTLLVCSASAQEYSADKKTFTLNKVNRYQIVEDEEDMFKVHVKFLTLKNQEFVGQKSIELNIETPDNDLVAFGKFIYDSRKFILIKERYRFHILNLYNNKIIGPLKPTFYSVGEDSQSSMLVNHKIIMDGRFVIGYCVDGGGFLFDLTDLYRPKEVKSASNPYTCGNRIYVLQDLENTDEKFGLYINIDGWEVNWKTIFTKKKIKSPVHLAHNRQYTEIEVEELIISPNSIDQQFTILKELVSERKYQFIVFNNSTGKQVLLPKHIDASDKKQVLGALQQE